MKTAVQDLELSRFETTALAQVSPLEATSRELLAKAEATRVGSDDDLLTAKQIKDEINEHARTVKELRLEITRPIDLIKDKFLQKEKEILYPLDQAKQNLQTKVLDYESEQERLRIAEEGRIDGIVEKISGLYKLDMTRSEVTTAQATAKKLRDGLTATDRDVPRIGVALVSLSGQLISRLTQIDEEERAAAERARQEQEAERLRKEAEKQSVEQARIAQEQAKVEAENRRLEDERLAIQRQREQLAHEQERQRLEREAIEVEKAAAKVEAARPKSNIVTNTKFEVVDADAVDRSLCSPDDKKIREAIKGGATDLAGIRIYAEKVMR